MLPLNLRDASVAASGDLSSADGSLLAAGLTASADRVVAGGLFVAIRGFKVDGHAFLDQAYARGAIACVVEDAAALQGRPGIVVKCTRRALSALAAAMYGEPSSKLKIVGITGTNGKTTTNWIVYHVLNRFSGGALRIGTLGSELLLRERFDGSLTSPDSLTIQELMGKALAAGARSCVMEVSSHALDQARVEDVQFDVAVYTNLSRDHLDYHQTFDAYFAAKKRLFALLASGGKDTKAAVINADDAYADDLLGFVRASGLKDFSFGRSEKAAFRMLSVEESASGMRLKINRVATGESFTIIARLIGLHNAENLAAAFASCIALGLSPANVVEALRDIPQVPGRLERIGVGEKRVFVDYAHTPDALERAIKTVRASTLGKLWVVFGCGGDRDRGKRPLMGKIAAELADRVVVTSDNPRTEDPATIIAEILGSGIEPSVVDPDRRAAIVRAISDAAPNDTVLIAGKGHEDYQIVGTTKLPFSDQEVAREALAR